MKTLKEIAQQVRSQLKKEFPKCKFSVTTEYFSMGQAMKVALMAAPFEATQDGKNYAQLNKYVLRQDDNYGDYNCNGALLTQEAWETMKRVDEIANGDNYDNSDITIDYFDVNYYCDINIGKWDKPFICTAPQQAVVQSVEPVELHQVTESVPTITRPASNWKVW